MGATLKEKHFSSQGQGYLIWDSPPKKKTRPEPSPIQGEYLPQKTKRGKERDLSLDTTNEKAEERRGGKRENDERSLNQKGGKRPKRQILHLNEDEVWDNGGKRKREEKRGLISRKWEGTCLNSAKETVIPTCFQWVNKKKKEKKSWKREGRKENGLGKKKKLSKNLPSTTDSSTRAPNTSGGRKKKASQKKGKNETLLPWSKEPKRGIKTKEGHGIYSLRQGGKSLRNKNRNPTQESVLSRGKKPIKKRVWVPFQKEKGPDKLVKKSRGDRPRGQTTPDV